MTSYRPPRDCPVCSTRLQITQLGCPNCGTGISGAFRPCDFCGLDDADRDLLRVFLASRGNMKELERHLGVSYPTARARFEDMLRKLGLGAPQPPSGKAAGPAGAGGGAAGAGGPAGPGGPGGPGGPDPRLEMLRAVAAGKVDVEQAQASLRPPT